jgi:probable F420-dependent oxidoreductase
VLNAAFWNSAILAREVATIDEFTDGRFELGLGAGYAANDFDAAGIPRETGQARVDHLTRTVTEVRRLVADPRVVSKPPIQQPLPPLLIAGQSHGVLDLVAEHADIASFTGGRVSKTNLGPAIPHDLKTLTERVGYLRTAAGSRAEHIELNIGLQMIEVTANRTAAADALSSFLPNFSLDEILCLPTYLIGSVDDIATQLLALRETAGFSYITVADTRLDDFAPVIDKLR